MPILLLNNSKNAIQARSNGAVWAEVAPIPLAQLAAWTDFEAWLGATASRGIPRIVFTPGRFQSPPASAEPTDFTDQIESSWRAWSSDGQQLLAESVRTLDEAAARHGIEALIWPQLHSIVSDIPGLLGITRRWERVSILLEPAALLPAGEESRAADFFIRLQTVLALPGIAALLLTNSQSRSIETGPLNPQLMRPLADVAIKAGLPLVLRQDSHQIQLDALGFSASADPA